jgi:hypothetical protein
VVRLLLVLICSAGEITFGMIQSVRNVIFVFRQGSEELFPRRLPPASPLCPISHQETSWNPELHGTYWTVWHTCMFNGPPDCKSSLTFREMENQKKKRKWGWVWLRVDPCLACTRPWVQSPAPENSSFKIIPPRVSIHILVALFLPPHTNLGDISDTILELPSMV